MRVLFNWRWFAGGVNQRNLTVGGGGAGRFPTRGSDTAGGQQVEKRGGRGGAGRRGDVEAMRMRGGRRGENQGQKKEEKGKERSAQGGWGGDGAEAVAGGGRPRVGVQR